MASPRPPLKPWNSDFTHADRERWIVVYPAYINSKKSVSQGRKIPKNLAIDNPTYVEIRDVLSSAGCSIDVENKVYCKERDHKDLKYRGRIRVHLKDEEGTPVKEEFPDRRHILLFLAETIPKLKTRLQSQGQGTSQQQAGAGGGKKKNRKK